MGLGLLEERGVIRLWDNYIQVCPKNGICHYVNTRVYVMGQTSRLAEKPTIADSSEHLINLNH